MTIINFNKCCAELKDTNIGLFKNTRINNSLHCVRIQCSSYFSQEMQVAFCDGKNILAFET